MQVSTEHRNSFLHWRIW